MFGRPLSQTVSNFTEEGDGCHRTDRCLIGFRSSKPANGMFGRKPNCAYHPEYRVEPTLPQRLEKTLNISNAAKSLRAMPFAEA